MLITNKAYANLIRYLPWVIVILFAYKTYSLLWTALFSFNVFQVTLEKESGFEKSFGKDSINLKRLCEKNKLENFKTVDTMIQTPWNNLNIKIAAYPAKFELSSKYIFSTNKDTVPSNCRKIDYLDSIILHECN